jgi:carbamate kinase
VPAVYRSFGEPEQEEVRALSADEARELLPTLAEGSMRPKVEAALAFGRATLITNFDALESALRGEGGTRIA